LPGPFLLLSTCPKTGVGRPFQAVRAGWKACPNGASICQAGPGGRVRRELLHHDPGTPTRPKPSTPTGPSLTDRKAPRGAPALSVSEGPGRTRSSPPPENLSPSYLLILPDRFPSGRSGFRLGRMVYSSATNAGHEWARIHECRPRMGTNTRMPATNGHEYTNAGHEWARIHECRPRMGHECRFVDGRCPHR